MLKLFYIGVKLKFYLELYLTQKCAIKNYKLS